MSGKELGYQYSKLVTVSGEARNAGTGYSNTNFTINLGPNMQKVARVSVASVTFPNSAFNVNGGSIANNSFAIVVGGVTTEYTVEPGYYNTTTLMSNVQTAINTYLTTLGAGQSVALTQDSISNFVTLTYTAGSSGVATITLADTEQGSGIWELLGFDSLPLTGATITATNLPALGGLKTVYLQSSSLSPGNMYDKDGEIKNTLLAIPISAAFGVNNIFECKVDQLCEITYMTPRDLTSVDFQLTDRRGNIVDLHGGNLTVNLKIWFYRY